MLCAIDGRFGHLLSQTSDRRPGDNEPAVNNGGPFDMARTRRRRGGTVGAVKCTARRVRTTARRRAPSAGGDLLKAVQGLIKALPIGELEKRLAGLERTVARLESNARGAVRRAVGGRKRTTAKRTTAKRAGTRRRTTAKRATTAKRTVRRAK